MPEDSIPRHAAQAKMAGGRPRRTPSPGVRRSAVWRTGLLLPEDYTSRRAAACGEVDFRGDTVPAPAIPPLPPGEAGAPAGLPSAPAAGQGCCSPGRPAPLPHRPCPAAASERPGLRPRPARPLSGLSLGLPFSRAGLAPPAGRVTPHPRQPGPGAQLAAGCRGGIPWAAHPPAGPAAREEYGP